MPVDPHRTSERPQFPEEARSSGHDAELTPAAGGKDVGVRRGSAPVDAGSTPSPAGVQASQGAVDAAFLVKGFGIPPGDSARLVTPGIAGKPNPTEEEARRLLAEDDPLKDVPTPKEPATDLTADTDEERLKPVLHQPNRRASNL